MNWKASRNNRWHAILAATRRIQFPSRSTMFSLSDTRQAGDLGEQAESRKGAGSGDPVLRNLKTKKPP